MKYDSIDAVRATLLKWIFLESPRAARYYLDHGKTFPQALPGRALHCATLTPRQMGKQFAVWYGPRRGQEYKEFAAVAETRKQEVLTLIEADQAISIAASVRAHPIAGPLIRQRGKAEHTLLWEQDGHKCKAKLDKVGHRGLLDLKGVQSVEPAAIIRAILRYGWDMQLAWYADGAAANGFGALPVWLVCVEKTPPYEVAVFQLDETWLELGRGKCAAALETLTECERTGKWPGRFEAAPIDLAVPAWALPEDEPHQLTYEGESI